MCGGIYYQSDSGVSKACYKKSKKHSAHCNTSASFRAKRLSPETMNPNHYKPIIVS